MSDDRNLERGCDGGPLPILLVEDNPGDARLLIEMLRESCPDEFEVRRAGKLSQAADAIGKTTPAAILLDLNLPDSAGLETVARMNSLAPRAPIVVLTSSDSDTMGIEAVRLGAQDYLAKGTTDGQIVRRVLHHAIERKRIQEQLRDLNETLEARVAERTALALERLEQIRALTMRLVETEERERRRLAGILHDDLQQTLVAAKIALFVAQTAGNPEKTGDAVAKVDRLLDECVQKARSLSHELSPPVLHDGTLEQVMNWLADWMRERHGLEVRVAVTAETDADEAGLPALLFSIVRELLFNVVKHAGVACAEVSLDRGPDGSLRVTVADDGAGFSPDRAQKGFGLLSINERVRHAGGSIEIDSLPGQGTRAYVGLPATRSPAPRR